MNHTIDYSPFSIELSSVDAAGCPVAFHAVEGDAVSSIVNQILPSYQVVFEETTPGNFLVSRKEYCVIPEIKTRLNAAADSDLLMVSHLSGARYMTASLSVGALLADVNSQLSGLETRLSGLETTLSGLETILNNL